MQEATATASEPTETPTLYAFDAPEYIIRLNVRTEENPLIVQHKLRKPTFNELEIRDKKQSPETITRGNEEIIESASSAPDAELWDKLILSVQGYAVTGSQKADGSDWIPDPQSFGIPIKHKIEAVRAIHQAQYEVVGKDDDADVFVLGATECEVRQTVAGFQVTHTLREMTEAERVEFDRKSYTASFVRGKSKDVRTRIQSSLKAYVEVYDKLITRIEGGMVDGREYLNISTAIQLHADGKVSNRFLAQIDPLFKRVIVNTMLGAQNVVLSD